MSELTFLQEELQRQIRRTGAELVIGLDNDRAGRDGTKKVAEAVLELGIKPMSFKVTQWVTERYSDWNSLLQAGWEAHKATAYIDNAVTWMQVMIEAAKPDQQGTCDEKALKDLVTLVAQMDVYDQARQRDQVCDTLDLSKRTFDDMLRAVRREMGVNDDGKPKYMVMGGRMVRRYYDRNGVEIYQPLCNFEAKILADVVEDDGDMQERRFRIGGSLQDGTRLQDIEVPVDDFTKMAWPLSGWGARAFIEAGSATKDHLRAAMQSLSKDITTEYIYSHLGWREIGGDRVYLTAAGAVGRDDVKVDLPHDLIRFRVSPLSEVNTYSPEQIKAAMKASLKFLEIGQEEVTIPLWAAMYLAPLSSIVPPSFTIWIYGTTGSMKSTAVALAMCHFGKFAYNTPPASWTGTTNALEKKAFLVKDGPLWIDDYVVQSTFAGMNDLKRKVDQLLRDWGNRAGRSRMRADLKLRQTYAPRGLIISTAEQLPPGQSIQARLFQVSVDPTMVTRGPGSPLTVAQTEEAELYPIAMAHYLQWVAKYWDKLESELPTRLLHYTEKAREKGAHLRMPANVAHLFLGYQLGLRYAEVCGAITADEREAREELGWNTLVGLGEEQQEAASEEKPVEMYLEAITQMLTQGSAFLRHREYYEDATADWPISKNNAPEFLGWYGNDDSEVRSQVGFETSRYWYLIPQVTFKAVSRFYQAAGVVFPDTPRGVKRKLEEEGMVFPATGKGHLYQLTIPGRPWVLRILNPIYTP